MSRTKLAKYFSSLGALTYLLWGLTFATSVGFDQATKVAAEENLMKSSHGSDLRVYTGRQLPLGTIGTFEGKYGGDGPYVYFGLNYVRNLGAAWGALANANDKFRVPFFFAISAVAALVIIVLFRKTASDRQVARFAMILILSGAAGNLIDRIRVGYVIDWIDFRWSVLGWKYNFPNFNLADAAITAGVIILGVEALLFDIKKRGPAEGR
jgi:signal peptidase II